MPRRRRTAARRPPMRRKRITYRKSRIYRHVRVGTRSRPVHFFKRTVNFNNLGSILYGHSVLNTNEGVVQNTDFTQFHTGNGGASNVTYFAAAMFFQLNDVPDVSDFVNLFDRYKLAAVSVKLRSFNVSSLADAQGQANGQLGAQIHVITDYDDATVPTASQVGIDALREHENYKSYNVFNSRGLFLKRYVRPRVALAAYNGAFGGYTNLKSQWTDTNSVSVQHYGLKFIVEAFSSAAAFEQNLNFTIEVTYYIMCKDVK